MKNKIMTKEEIYQKALDNRCKYESSKEVDYDTYLAIMDAMVAIIDAMDEYAQQQVDAVSNSFCCICNNRLTEFELANNMCIKCGNSPSPVK